MRKKSGYLLAMLVTLVLLAVGLTVGASADMYDVATADDFTSKISSAASGDIINVTADIEVSAASTIDKTLTITSSNGSTVTVSVSRLLMVGTGETKGNLLKPYKYGRCHLHPFRIWRIGQISQSRHNPCWTNCSLPYG